MGNADAICAYNFYNQTPMRRRNSPTSTFRLQTSNTRPRPSFTSKLRDLIWSRTISKLRFSLNSGGGRLERHLCRCLLKFPKEHLPVLSPLKWHSAPVHTGAIQFQIPWQVTPHCRQWSGSNSCNSEKSFLHCFLPISLWLACTSFVWSRNEIGSANHTDVRLWNPADVARFQSRTVCKRGAKLWF